MHIAWRELALGAALMYALDPSLGASRRALFRARAARLGRWLGAGVQAALRRFPGARFGRRDPCTDDEILARVREGLGCVSHPGSIDVRIEAGHLTVSGPILAREVVKLLRHVGRVRGIVRVDNRLRVRRLSERVPEWLEEPGRGGAADLPH